MEPSAVLNMTYAPSRQSGEIDAHTGACVVTFQTEKRNAQEKLIVRPI